MSAHCCYRNLHIKHKNLHERYADDIADKHKNPELPADVGKGNGSSENHDECSKPF